jgi:hypothetical protein
VELIYAEKSQARKMSGGEKWAVAAITDEERYAPDPLPFSSRPSEISLSVDHTGQKYQFGGPKMQKRRG